MTNSYKEYNNGKTINMISLKELLHSIQNEEESGLLSVDEWRWPDVDHLVTMGFEFGDDYHMHTAKDPKITIYQKKDKDKDGKEIKFFFIEEKNRQIKRFKTFNDVIDYFDTYEQPILDKNK
jgi:hypothetical protein